MKDKGSTGHKNWTSLLNTDTDIFKYSKFSSLETEPVTEETVVERHVTPQNPTKPPAPIPLKEKIRKRKQFFILRQIPENQRKRFNKHLRKNLLPEIPVSSWISVIPLKKNISHGKF